MNGVTGARYVETTFTLFSKLNSVLDSAMRFEIDARRFKWDWPYIGVLAVWGLCVLGFVCLFVWAEFWFGVVLGVVMLVLWVMVPFGIRHSRVQILEVTPECLTLTRGNRREADVRIERGEPLELTLEYYDPDPGRGDGGEMTSTLNLWEDTCGFRRRHILGWWISEEGKVRVFEALFRFLIHHEFKVTARNEVANKEWRTRHTKRPPTK